LRQNLISEFVNKKNVFAVVGASRDPRKYGHQVYRDLRNGGFRVYCVNPNLEELLGDKCYSYLDVLPVKPDVVDVVVPPKVTEQVVKTCRRLGIRKVWMQPGSESEKAIEFCKENDIDVIYGVCVMIERKRQTEK
jgi:predicted CoA-binding protein